MYKREFLNLSNLLWHTENLDLDFEAALKKYNVTTGSFLDIGCGHGTQSNLLEQIGFDVTGIDSSQVVLDYAIRNNSNVKYIKDDIFSYEPNTKFDYILDRGCFHMLDEDKKDTYVDKVHTLTNKLVFLKVGNQYNSTTGREFIPALNIKQVVDQWSKKFKILSQNDGIFNPMTDAQFFTHLKYASKRKWAGNTQSLDPVKSTFFVMQPL